MALDGEMLIGGKSVKGSAGTLRAFNPTTNAEIPHPEFSMGGARELNLAVDLADAAFDEFQALPLEKRAFLLERIAVNIEELGDELLNRASEESGLPYARYVGERARTVGQLRLFAKVVRDGDFLDVTIDHAQPDRPGIPGPDLRLMNVGLGPVAVFGASNFPLAFSVAGGDTASALAAGCPVVVKGHNAHLGTSELVGKAIQKAVKEAGAPEGVFSLIYGLGNDIGHDLVVHPKITAVGFTGSQAGGVALVKAASTRPVPIPVYAEMSSINPTFLLPSALENSAPQIAGGFIEWLVVSSGQFCTCPGLVVGVESPALDKFIEIASKAISAKEAQTLLTPGIASSYKRGTSQLRQTSGVALSGSGVDHPELVNSGTPSLFVTSGDVFLAESKVGEEVFGPSSVVVKAKDVGQLEEIARSLDGQLTATMHVGPNDESLAKKLLPILTRKAGRVLLNGFSVGVDVNYSMMHGGPFPATSNPMFTSVGAKAINRFLRPVSFQNFTPNLLPSPLLSENPLGVLRIIDGTSEARLKSSL